MDSSCYANVDGYIGMHQIADPPEKGLVLTFCQTKGSLVPRLSVTVRANEGGEPGDY